MKSFGKKQVYSVQHPHTLVGSFTLYSSLYTLLQLLNHTISFQNRHHN